MAIKGQGFCMVKKESQNEFYCNILGKNYVAVSFQLNHYLKDVSIAADILTTCNFICLIKCAS